MEEALGHQRIVQGFGVDVRHAVIATQHPHFGLQGRERDHSLPLRSVNARQQQIDSNGHQRQYKQDFLHSSFSWTPGNT